MNIVNLNQICKIVLVKKEKTNDYEWVENSENFFEWFKNLFRKNKVKKRYIKHWFGHKYYTSEEFLKEKTNYSISVTSGIIYEKPRVVLWHSDYNHGKEVRYFDTDKEAKEYYSKLREYVKQFDIPFIDFYAENKV